MVVGGIALVAAACGGRDGGGDTTAAPATPAPTQATQAPTTAPPPPETTTPIAPTTSAAPPTTLSPFLAVITGLAGEWSGSWTNTTFGSTGPTSAIMEVLDDGTIAVTIDLGGFVFGQGDPAEEMWIFNLADLTQPVTVQSETFGEVTAILSLEGARITAGDVPAAGIASFQFDASFEPGPSIVGVYIVGFDDGSIAEGTTEMQRVDP